MANSSSDTNVFKHTCVHLRYINQSWQLVFMKEIWSGTYKINVTNVSQGVIKNIFTIFGDNWKLPAFWSLHVLQEGQSRVWMLLLILRMFKTLKWFRLSCDLCALFSFFCKHMIAQWRPSLQIFRCRGLRVEAFSRSKQSAGL